MDNIHRIEEFLKLMACAASNGTQIRNDVVYANLIYLGVDDKKYDISDKFDKWIKHFYDIRNINVFVDPSWSYFCQFVNKHYFNCNVKLYIPLDKEHIERGAKELFEFLANENVSHISKIGKHVRFDDVVIRTNSAENANKIIEFVNKNQYIMEGIIPQNPFAVNDNNVSLAWDDRLSYNSVVAGWVSNYINWERDNNNLNNVSYSRFCAYIQEKSYDLFENGNGLAKYADKLLSENIIKDNGIYGSVDVGLANYYDVTKLILMALDPKMKKETLFNFIKIVSDRKYQRKNVDKIRKLRVRTNDKVNFSLQQRAAFKLSYEYMCESYGVEGSKERFIEFINSGDYSYISRYKGARDLLISNGITKDIAQLIVSSWKCDALDDAILATYNKYGFHQVYDSLSDLIDCGTFSKFTNDNNCRKKLIDRCYNNNIIEDIKRVIASEGYDIMYTDDLCSVYIDRVIGKVKTPISRV